MGRLIRYADDRCLYCRTCSYYLAGLPMTGVCPECGQPYDKRVQAPVSVGEVARALPEALRGWARTQASRAHAWCGRNARSIWVTCVILATSTLVITVGVVAMKKFYTVIGF